MIKKIAVFTGTRAEYGLLSLIIKGLEQSSKVELQLWVGGSHLSQLHGYTKNHIIDDGFVITEELDFLAIGDSPQAITQSLGQAIIKAADCFVRQKPDLLVLLGDRFEALAIAQAALIANVPVAHIHGGEITEGAMDDAFRHAITKLSYLHFTSTEPYRQRVIQLGEQPERVFNFGAPGIDNIKQLALLSLNDLNIKLGTTINTPYFLVTYHPETLTNTDNLIMFESFISALQHFPGYQVVITYPNADTFGGRLIQRLKRFAHENLSRVILFESVGQLNYLSLMQHATVVVGNSSSGIIEAPSFNIPTVNIGERQAGRLASKTVINSLSDELSIVAALNKALSEDFKKILSQASNPYGNGNACKRIISILEDFPVINMVKKFYNLPNEKQNSDEDEK